jgi:hypothetical protein
VEIFPRLILKCGFISCCHLFLSVNVEGVDNLDVVSFSHQAGLAGKYGVGGFPVDANCRPRRSHESEAGND